MRRSITLPCACLTALTLFSAAERAAAVVLLTDNYTVSSNVNDPNSELTDGRQGGTLATPTVSYVTRFAVGGNQCQVGNTTTFPGNANALLLAFGGAAYLNYDFSTVAAPISISFDGIVSSGQNTDTSNWIGMQVLGATTQTDFINTTDFGILFRANGGTQYFDHTVATTGATYTGATTGLNVFNNYTIVLSNTAGTGSAFGSSGSVVTYYENGTLLGTATIGQLSAKGYIGFSATSVAGMDNLVIQSVPEAHSLAIAGLAGGLLLSRRKRN